MCPFVNHGICHKLFFFQKSSLGWRITWTVWTIHWDDPFQKWGKLQPFKKIWHHGWNNQGLRWRSPPVGKRNAEMKTPLQKVPYKILELFIHVFFGWCVFLIRKKHMFPRPDPGAPPKVFPFPLERDRENGNSTSSTSLPEAQGSWKKVSRVCEVHVPLKEVFSNIA